MRSLRLGRPLLGAVLLSLFLHPAPPVVSASDDPWELLSALRQKLVEAGPTSVTFVQEYIPAGFESGDRETGRLAIVLPDCLRWDYGEPFPKSFLLLRNTVYSWNPEDAAGRRYEVEGREEPGLDLLRLDLPQLRGRYGAKVVSSSPGNTTIALAPREASTNLQEGTLTVTQPELRLVALEYRDREGNLSRFTFSGQGRLQDRWACEPPGNVAWKED